MLTVTGIQTFHMIVLDTVFIFHKWMTKSSVHSFSLMVINYPNFLNQFDMGRLLIIFNN